MFFQLFQILYLIVIHVFKVNILKNLEIYDIFYMLLLKHNNPRIEQINKSIIKLYFKVFNHKDYKIEVYINELKIYHLSKALLFCFLKRLKRRKK